MKQNNISTSMPELSSQELGSHVVDLIVFVGAADNDKEMRWSERLEELLN